MLLPPSLFFFFNDTATTEIYTLSLHDALPISVYRAATPLQITQNDVRAIQLAKAALHAGVRLLMDHRSEEHTSELQSQSNLVCRLLLEKKNKQNKDLFDEMNTFFLNRASDYCS